MKQLVKVTQKGAELDFKPATASCAWPTGTLCLQAWHLWLGYCCSVYIVLAAHLFYTRINCGYLMKEVEFLCL